VSSDWPTAVLADLCDSIDYGYTASAVADSSVGPKFLRITDIRKDGLRWDTVPHVEIDPRNLEKYQLNPGDIVVARTGAFTGSNAYVEPSVSAVFASYLVRLRTGPRLLSRFAYYFMQSQAYRDHVASVVGGSAQPNASAKALTQVEMPIPPLGDQRWIANTLGMLDDKIALNRRMGETLEQLARNHFHQVLDASGDRAPYRPLGDILAVIETGRRPKGGIKGITAGIPSVGAESITRIGEFDYSKTRYVPDDYFKSMSRGVVEDFDVLLYKDGGKPGVYEPHVSQFGLGFPFDDFCINEHVYRLRVFPPYT